MSQMSTETPAPSGKKENVFTRKIGPMPMWAWVAIIGAVIIGYAYYKNKNAASTASTASTTDASQVPQFVNQTYTQPSPPSAPGPPGPAGPPGPPGPGGVSPGGPVNRPPGPPIQPGGPMKTPPARTEKLRYKGNLDQIAKRNNISLEELLQLNPGLKRYEGTGHVFPVGTTVRV